MSNDFVTASQKAIVAVEIKNCFADSTYARPFRFHIARKILKEFNWNIIGKPIVSKRKDGRYAILDGQHRIWAINQRIASFTTTDDDVYFSEEEEILISVEMHENLSLDEEAIIHTSWNTGQSKMSQQDIFKSEVVGLYPDAVAIRQMLDRHEITVGNDIKKKGNLSCIQTVRKLHGISPKVLDKTFWILNLAWGDKSPQPDSAYYTDALSAVFYLLSSAILDSKVKIVIPLNLAEVLDPLKTTRVKNEPHEFDLAHLINRMRKKNSHQLQSDIRDGKKFFMSDSTGVQFVGAIVLQGWYNNKLRNKVEFNIPVSMTIKTLRNDMSGQNEDLVIDRRQ
jgi:hypothetical protein